MDQWSLVGHSYGGMVITNAAYNNPNVKGLVYIAAFAPNEGQSLADFVDIKKLPKDFLITDSGGFSYINPTIFGGSFAQDVNSSEADIMAIVQKPFSQSILAKIWPSCMETITNMVSSIRERPHIPPDARYVCSQNK